MESVFKKNDVGFGRVRIRKFKEFFLYKRFIFDGK